MSKESDMSNNTSTVDVVVESQPEQTQVQEQQQHTQLDSIEQEVTEEIAVKQPAAVTNNLSETITDDADKLKMLHAQVAQSETEAIERKEDVDARSIYVGNVDYEASPEELQRHFQEIGAMNRVTIMLNKFTGKPKGFAYIEFAEPASVMKSLSLNDSVFRSRNLKVIAKRTNIPGFNYRGRGGFRGRGGPRGRGGFRGGRGRFTPY